MSSSVIIKIWMSFSDFIGEFILFSRVYYVGFCLLTGNMKNAFIVLSPMKQAMVEHSRRQNTKCNIRNYFIKFSTHDIFLYAASKK